MAPAAPPSCEAVQVVTVQYDGKLVEILRLAVTPSKSVSGKAMPTLVALTPLDVLLTSDFGLETGKAAPKLYRFRNCNHLGCFVVVPLDPKLLVAFGKSEQGAAWFRLTNGKVVKVVFPLGGFAAAMDRLASGKGLPPPTGSGSRGPGSGEHPTGAAQ